MYGKNLQPRPHNPLLLHLPCTTMHPLASGCAQGAPAQRPSLCLPLCADDAACCCCLSQDGIIDYNEFVTMMRAGNGGIGRKSLTGSWASGNLFGSLVKGIPPADAPK